MATYKECPFCGEEVLGVAKKCKHCGEWFAGKPEGIKVGRKGSTTARAVSRGIKEQKFHEDLVKASPALGCAGGVVAIFVAYALGVTADNAYYVIFGVVALGIILAIFLWYWKE